MELYCDELGRVWKPIDPIEGKLEEVDNPARAARLRQVPPEVISARVARKEMEDALQHELLVAERRAAVSERVKKLEVKWKESKTSTSGPKVHKHSMVREGVAHLALFILFVSLLTVRHKVFEDYQVITAVTTPLTHFELNNKRGEIRDVDTIEKVWEYLRGPLKQALAPDTWYNGMPVLNKSVGVLSEYNVLTGPIQFVQVRARLGQDCRSQPSSYPAFPTTPPGYESEAYPRYPYCYSYRDKEVAQAPFGIAGPCANADYSSCQFGPAGGCRQEELYCTVAGTGQGVCTSTPGAIPLPSDLCGLATLPWNQTDGCKSYWSPFEWSLATGKDLRPVVGEYGEYGPDGYMLAVSDMDDYDGIIAILKTAQWLGEASRALLIRMNLRNLNTAVRRDPLPRLAPPRPARLPDP